MCVGPRTKLIRARERLGLRRVDFARRVGISPGYVTYVEEGQRDPSLPIVQRWLAALGEGATVELFEPQTRPWRNTAEMLCLSNGG